MFIFSQKWVSFDILGTQKNDDSLYSYENQPLNERMSPHYVLRMEASCQTTRTDFVSVDDVRRIIHLFLKANSSRYDMIIFGASQIF